MLLIITSTGDRLFSFIYTDDLERPWTQWRIQKFGIGGGKVVVGSGQGAMPLPRKFLKILCRNHAFWCNIFTCF